MSKNNQGIIIKHKENVLFLCIMVSIFMLLAACGSSTHGNGQSTVLTGQGGGPGSSNSAGSPQRPDPCSLISANQVQQLIPGSQFPAPTPGGNLNEGGPESSCSFADVNGTMVILTLDPAEPTWSGIKSLQTNNPTGIPTIKGIGDDALYYGDLCVLKGDYLLQVKVTNYNVSDDTNQQQEKQIALAALKKW